jgi:hypothetical protein
MVSFSKKEWPCLMLAAYLVIAIMGIEPLRSINFWEDKLISSDSLNPVIYNTIDCPTEDMPVISMVIRHSFSPLRIGPLRILIFPGTQNAGVLFQSFFKALKKINYRTEKHIILLKLRI